MKMYTEPRWIMRHRLAFAAGNLIAAIQNLVSVAEQAILAINYLDDVLHRLKEQKK